SRRRHTRCLSDWSSDVCSSDLPGCDERAFHDPYQSKGEAAKLRQRMITYLEVRNLAIVEELAIEPGAGLNVLTGETGAGKSLLIDSLEFLRGARGSTEQIRSGSDRMTAEAVFHLPVSCAAPLDEQGIDVERNGA